MLNFTFQPLNIPDVLLITPKKFGDDRGFFMETYKLSEFQVNGISVSYVQDNHSKSKTGVLRGLHYQLKPFDQGKLVRVVSGSLLDVAVDIRQGSPFYGQHIAHVISAQNHEMLWIPSGFAHGTLILEDDTELLYKVTNEYSPSHDRGIL